MRWLHLGRRLGITQLCPLTGAPIAICSSAAIIYLGLDREVRGQLLEDRSNQQGCLVQFFQDAFLLSYVAIVELNEQRCPHNPHLSKEDITIDFLPQPSSDSLSLLQYVSRLAAVGVTLRRAENANQAEGLAPINGVCLNLALVASTRLLVELYMLITSIAILTRSLGILAVVRPWGSPMPADTAAATKATWSCVAEITGPSPETRRTTRRR